MSNNTAQLTDKQHAAIKDFFECISPLGAMNELNGLFTSFLMDEERKEINSKTEIALENVSANFTINKIVNLLHILDSNEP